MVDYGKGVENGMVVPKRWEVSWTLSIRQIVKWYADRQGDE